MRTWRTIEIFKDKSFDSLTGKDTYALPRTHMIGDLWLDIRVLNDAAGNNDPDDTWDSIERHLDVIKIKSGSRTFKEFDGEMCRHMATLRDGRLPPEIRDMGKAVEQESVFPIYFGLEPQDEDVILPAPLLDSLDLVLEHSWPDDSGEGFDSAEFDLYANVLEPTADLEDKMILIQEKKQDVTFATSGGWKPYDLTLDERRLLRKVYVEAYTEAKTEGATCSDIKLKADNEEVIAATWRQLQFQNAVDAHLNFHQHINWLSMSGAAEIYLSRIPDVRYTLGDTDTGAADYLTTSGITGDEIGITFAAANEVPRVDMFSDVLPTVAVLDFDRDKSLRRLQPQGIRDLDLQLKHVLASTKGAIYEESLQKIW